MVLAAPELVIAERIELLDEIEIAAELEHRVLADRVMRGEEGPKFEASHLETSHGVFSELFFDLVQSNYGAGTTKAIAYSKTLLRKPGSHQIGRIVAGLANLQLPTHRLRRPLRPPP